MTKPVEPPFTPLEVQVATTMCQHRRITRGMPSMAEIQHAMPLARSIIQSVRAADKASKA